MNRLNINTAKRILAAEYLEELRNGRRCVVAGLAALLDLFSSQRAGPDTEENEGSIENDPNGVKLHAIIVVLSVKQLALDIFIRSGGKRGTHCS